MGQAFDRDGQILGEAFGSTKREVFDKLMAQHGDAAEIRIRSQAASNSELNGASSEMPRYKCHKEVHALKIEAIEDPNSATDGSRLLRFVEYAYAPIGVGGDWIARHRPVVGGYYVVYDDGYASFSPAKAFEYGYTRL
jgi:hypothetical protein